MRLSYYFIMIFIVFIILLLLLPRIIIKREEMILFDYLKYFKGGTSEKTISNILPSKYKYEEVVYENGNEYKGNIWYRFNNNKIYKITRYAQEKGLSWRCSITLYYDYNNKLSGFAYNSGDTLPKMKQDDEINIRINLLKASPNGNYISLPPRNEEADKAARIKYNESQKDRN